MSHLETILTRQTLIDTYETARRDLLLRGDSSLPPIPPTTLSWTRPTYSSREYHDFGVFLERLDLLIQALFDLENTHPPEAPESVMRKMVLPTAEEYAWYAPRFIQQDPTELQRIIPSFDGMLGYAYATFLNDEPIPSMMVTYLVTHKHLILFQAQGVSRYVYTHYTPRSFHQLPSDVFIYRNRFYTYAGRRQSPRFLNWPWIEDVLEISRQLAEASNLTLCVFPPTDHPAVLMHAWQDHERGLAQRIRARYAYLKERVDNMRRHAVSFSDVSERILTYSS